MKFLHINAVAPKCLAVCKLCSQPGNIFDTIRAKMNEETRPICHVVAGPNGSGKSTFALRYLPEYASVWLDPALAEPMRKELGI